MAGVFLAPAVMAVVAGASAPVVFSALKKGGISAWGLAVAWNVWGMADFAVGWTDVVILRPPWLEQLPWLLFPTVFGPVLFVLHRWCLVLLVNPRVRAHFAARELA